MKDKIRVFAKSFGNRRYNKFVIISISPVAWLHGSVALILDGPCHVFAHFSS